MSYRTPSLAPPAVATVRCEPRASPEPATGGSTSPLFPDEGRPRAPRGALVWLLLALCASWPAGAAAQFAPGWDGMLIVDPFPPAFLSDWENNPTIASLTVTNETGSDAFVTIHFTVFDGSGATMVDGRSDPQLVPDGMPTVFHTASALDGTSSYDPAIEDVIARTGRFPEGDYTACVTLSTESGFVVADNLCEFFTTFSPDPPYLLFPMDRDTVPTLDPIFEWTPPQVPVTVQPVYVVQLAEILPGQTPHEALATRIPHYENTGFTPSLQYPLGALPFEQGRRYAWWVQALDLDGYPLSSNQGRSEVWTFTYLAEGVGEPPGTEVGGDTRLVAAGAAGTSPPAIANLGSSTYEDVRDAFQEAGDGLRIPVPLPNLAFQPLDLWNVRVDFDDVGRAIAVTGDVTLPDPLGAVDVALIGSWGSEDTGVFALGLDPAGLLRLPDWIDGLQGTPLGELDMRGSILTVGNAARTVDLATLPAAVEAFYGTPTVSMDVGVSVHQFLDLSSTTIADRLGGLGMDVGDAELEGLLGIDPNALFGTAGAALAPTLDLSASLSDVDLAGLPEWLTVESIAVRFTNDPAPTAVAEVAVEAAVGGETLGFALEATLSDDPVGEGSVLAGRLTTPWEAPFGIEWLALDSVLLALAPAPGGDAVDASLAAWLTLGSQTVELGVELSGAGDDAEASLTAALDELAVADLLAFLGEGLGAGGLGGQLPAGLPALQDVTLELRSGDPATLTVLATATAFGQSTDLMYTLIPSDLLAAGEGDSDSGDGAGGSGAGGGTDGGSAGLFALRLADWSLAGLLPQIAGTPLGGLSFPEVSFVLGPTPPDAAEPGGEPAEPGGDDQGTSWTLPWGSLPAVARDFLLPSHPCAGGGCAPSGGGAGGDEPAGGGGSEGLSLRPGLNFSAPISLADLSGAFGGLFDLGGGGGGAGGESSPVVLQGSPGISLAALLSGDFELSSLVDIRGVLPPPPAKPFGWPDWIGPTARSIQITNDPEISVGASVTLEADLDGSKTFDVTGTATNAGGGGAGFEGLMRGSWEQPFGLEWLTLDSVRIALAAGSVGPRIGLGAGIEIGGATAALDIEVRGPEGARVLELTALARDVSTADVASFLNDAFDAGLAVPADPITLDSLEIGFATGEASAFHLVGGFSAELDPVQGVTGLASLLPGVSAPDEVPFSLGGLGDAWFELHVVPDSVRGGLGGAIALGGPSGTSFDGSAAIGLGSGAPGADEWLTLDLEVTATDLSAPDALAALESALPAGWGVPSTLEAASDVTLETAILRLALDGRTDSTSVELSGSGRLDSGDGGFEAELALGLFDVSDATWANGSLSLGMADLSVAEALEQAASLLPGEWEVPDDLDALDAVQIETGSITVAFDTQADSLSAHVDGAGTVGSDALRATTSLTLAQKAGEDWAAGHLEIRIRDVTLPDALDRVADVLPGDWTLPPAASGLAPIVVDSASLGMAFDSRDGTLAAGLNGAIHLGESEPVLVGAANLQLVRIGTDEVVEGRVTIAVTDLGLTGVLGQTAELLPGDWALPDDFTAFDALVLDSASLDVGFSTAVDSVGATVVGLGRLGDGGLTAAADLTLARVGELSGANGAVTLASGGTTMSDALGQVAALLPGEWSVPEGLDALDAVALDTAAFVLGFDTWADSVFAGVSGEGRLGEVNASAALDFTHVAAADRVQGLVRLELGEVGAGEAVEQIAELLPGDWELPGDFSSFDAVELTSASLFAGFDTQGDSLWAGFEGAGDLDGRIATARLGFARIEGASYGSGRVTVELGDLTLVDAFDEAASMLPGDWETPDVGFEIGSLRDVSLDVGFDTRLDSLWAGVDAVAELGGYTGRTTLAVVSVGAGGTARSWVAGAFTADIGNVTVPGALQVAADMLPGSPQVPTLDFELGGLSDAVLGAGFRVGDADSTWAGITGGIELAGLTGSAEVALALGQSTPSGRLSATFDESFGVGEVVTLLSSFLPAGGFDLPPLGPLDVSLNDPLFTLDFGQRTGVSLGGSTELFGKDGDALFSAATIEGRPQLIFGVQIPDLAFSDLLPEFSNPVTDALSLDLAALTITQAEGRVDDEELSPEERRFFQPLAGGLDDFTVEFRPGLNLTGLIPLGSAGAMKDMVDMLSPGANSLMLQGTLPLPGFGGLRDLALRAGLPPMRPPGSPAWFVEGEIAVQITGRPSVGVAGALTVDVDGDTLTFDIESNVAIVPAGVELSIAGGLSARNPWVAPMGIDWLTLNEIRLALGLSPLSVRLGFLGDAVFGTKSLRVALGTKINIYTGVPTGILVLAEAPDGMSIAELAEVQQQIAGPAAEALPIDALPNMAVRDLGIRVATYTDFDLGVEAGVGFSGAFLVGPGSGELTEVGRIELDISPQGILGYGRLAAFSVGPVSFDEALVDLALTIPDQHLIMAGGATIDGAFSADIALALSSDSMSFAFDYMMFDAFRTNLAMRAGFNLLNPTFAIHAALYPEFTDELTMGVLRDVTPVAATTLEAASVTLQAARVVLDESEEALDDAIWLAGEAARVTMNNAYSAYRYAVNRYNSANSRYRRYRSRCSWRRPRDCARASYWGGVRSFWSGQRTATYRVYASARVVYQNQTFLQNNPVVNAARGALDQARRDFNDAQAEVDRLRTMVDALQRWMDSYDSCATCARPPIPVSVVSAEFDAALEGFFGDSGVELAVGYQVYGDHRTLAAGFSGSVAGLVSSLATAVSNALF